MRDGHDARQRWLRRDVAVFMLLIGAGVLSWRVVDPSSAFDGGRAVLATVAAVVCLAMGGWGLARRR